MKKLEHGNILPFYGVSTAIRGSPDQGREPSPNPNLIIPRKNLRYKAWDSRGSGPTHHRVFHHLVNPSKASTGLARVSLLVITTTFR